MFRFFDDDVDVTPSNIADMSFFIGAGRHLAG